jgi:hypothetical protein
MLRRCRVADRGLWSTLSVRAWQGIRACAVSLSHLQDAATLDDARLLARAMCWSSIDGRAVLRLLQHAGVAFILVDLEALVAFSVCLDLEDFAEERVIRDAGPAPAGLRWDAVAASALRALSCIDHRHRGGLAPQVFGALAAAARLSHGLAVALVADERSLAACGAAASACAACRAAWFSLAAALRCDPGDACRACLRAGPVEHPDMRVAARAVAASIGLRVSAESLAADPSVVAAFSCVNGTAPVAFLGSRSVMHAGFITRR